MPTVKQKLVLGALVENGGNIYRAMRAVGYSHAMAKNPQKLTQSKGFQELLESAGVTDDKLTEVLSDGLNATKPVFKNNNSTGKVEKVTDEPDHITRHKFLETGLKLKGHTKEGDTPPTNQYNTYIQNNQVDPNTPDAKTLAADTLDMLMNRTKRKIIDQK